MIVCARCNQPLMPGQDYGYVQVEGALEELVHTACRPSPRTAAIEQGETDPAAPASPREMERLKRERDEARRVAQEILRLGECFAGRRLMESHEWQREHPWLKDAR